MFIGLEYKKNRVSSTFSKNVVFSLLVLKPRDTVRIKPLFGLSLLVSSFSVHGVILTALTNVFTTDHKPQEDLLMRFQGTEVRSA